MTVARSWTGACGLLLGGLLIADPLVARGVGSGSVPTVYEAGYFAAFAPSTALDMARRVPGFTIETGNQDIRGFAQAAGNVVINGARPSSKTESLDTILARIPASRVARFEIGPGELFGAEFAGRAQVLNVVLVTQGGLAGSIELGQEGAYTRASPYVRASALLRRGGSTLNVSAGYSITGYPEHGYDRLLALPDRTQTQLRRKTNDWRDHDAFASASWEWLQSSDRAVRLNARISRNDTDLNQLSVVTRPGGYLRNDSLTLAPRRLGYELGGDVTRPLFAGAIKLVALATRRRTNFTDIAESMLGGESDGGFVQEIENRRAESVGRLTWSRADWQGWSIETGAEIALNSLRANTDLFTVSPAGERVRTDLPVDQVVVREKRFEGFVSAGRQLQPNLRVDASLTYERSKLSVTGGARAERSLHFLKPRIAADWRPGDGWHAQLSIARSVAQLDFGNFASFADLANDRVNAGNSELVPQRAWELLLTVEHPFFRTGLARAEFGWNEISQLQDRIPIAGGFDAPGNLGTGRQMFARATVDSPLTELGLRGGHLKLTGEARHSAVKDPYTGARRPFTNATAWALAAEFRHDLGKLTWGFTAHAQPHSAAFRRDEIDVDAPEGMRLDAFVEYHATTATTFSLGANNLLNAKPNHYRTFFVPDRSAPDPASFEERVREQTITVFARLRHAFG